MQVKADPPALPAWNKSPMRPPHPELAPSGLEDCQYDCWSLCEKSLGGKLAPPAVYWALVMGCTKLPILRRTLNAPELKRGIKAANSGALAYCCAPGNGVAGLSTVGSQNTLDLAKFPTEPQARLAEAERVASIRAVVSGAPVRALLTALAAGEPGSGELVVVPHRPGEAFFAKRSDSEAVTVVYPLRFKDAADGACHARFVRHRSTTD